MHASVELVKDSVLTILPALAPSEAIAVTKVLVSDVGLESTADLQFVEATDLTRLKPSEAIAVAKVLVSDVGVESTAEFQFVEATDLTTLKPSEASGDKGAGQ